MRRRGPPDKVQRARIRVLHDLVGCDVGIERPERMDVAGGVTPRRSRLVFAMLDMGGGTSNNYTAEGGKECESEWVGGVGNSRITEHRGVPLNSTAFPTESPRGDDHTTRAMDSSFTFATQSIIGGAKGEAGGKEVGFNVCLHRRWLKARQAMARSDLEWSTSVPLRGH